jgi:hypothetical protein
MENEIKNIPDIIEGTEEALDIINPNLNGISNAVAEAGTYLDLTVNALTVKANFVMENATYKAAFLLSAFPLGSIFFTAVNSNPSTWLGGTWIQWGSGRVPVGVYTSDTNFNTVEKTGGATTVTLGVNEMPAHRHDVSDDRNTDCRYGSEAAGTANPNSKWVPTGWLTDWTVVKGNRAYTMNTISVGGGAAHSNLQPYITCYMWKRTA